MAASLELNEPIVVQLKQLLEENMPGIIETINGEHSDIVLPPPAQVLDHQVGEGEIKGGIPIVCIQDMPSSFEDDLQFALTGYHEMVVASIMQNADKGTLGRMLRRYTSAVARTIQADRLAGASGILKKEPAHVLYTAFERVEPGPLLGEPNPLGADQPPSTYMSWSSLVIRCRREEIGF